MMKDEKNTTVQGTWEAFEKGISLFREGKEDPRTEEGAMLYQQLRKMIAENGIDSVSLKDAPTELLYWWKETVRQISAAEFAERYAGTSVNVSLTSYPARIQSVPAVLESVYAQTRRPDRVLLWLAKEQFPCREADLPERLLQDSREGRLEIRWCDDLKPHKKYFYAMQEIKTGVIITIDDDLVYPETIVELLLLSYARHPQAISAGRVNLMAISENGDILPYTIWLRGTDMLLDQPSMQLAAIGVGGVLYPAGCLPEQTFDEKGIRETCLMADDLWLKAMETLATVPVTAACEYWNNQKLEGTQTSALWNTNAENNDSQMRAILSYLDERKDGDRIRKNLMDRNLFCSQFGVKAYGMHANHMIGSLKMKTKKAYIEKNIVQEKRKKEKQKYTEEIHALKLEIQEIKNSRTYKIGSGIVKPFSFLKRKVFGRLWKS